MKHARKFKNERVLNHAAHTYQLTRPSKVGPVMEMIRECQPRSFEEWENFYWENAETKTANPVKVTEGVIGELGERLYEKIVGTVQPEWERAFASITREECVEYIREVTLHRTYDGYLSEISVIYGNLAKHFPTVRFEESDSKLDHSGDIDYLGWVGNHAFGVQIKPVTASHAFAGYSVSDRMRAQFESFTEEYGGKVFIVYSVKKSIKNQDVTREIAAEVDRLSRLNG